MSAHPSHHHSPSHADHPRPGRVPGHRSGLPYEGRCPGAARRQSVYRGTTYSFCNPKCKSKFDADPERYLAPPSAPTAGSHPHPRRSPPPTA